MSSAELDKLWAFSKALLSSQTISGLKSRWAPIFDLFYKGLAVWLDKLWNFSEAYFEPESFGSSLMILGLKIR